MYIGFHTGREKNFTDGHIIKEDSSCSLNQKIFLVFISAYQNA